MNASTMVSREFLQDEEIIRQKNKEIPEKDPFFANDLESESLLKHDCLAQNFQDEQRTNDMVFSVAQPAKFTSTTTLQISEFLLNY